MSAPRFELVVDADAAVGEGAVWSSRLGGLLWVDIPAGRLHLHVPGGEDQAWETGEPLGCVAEAADGAVILASTSGFRRLDASTGEIGAPFGPAPGARGHRFNDGAVAPCGRFHAGTMPLSGPSAQDAGGRLYALRGGVAAEVMRGFHTQNGLAFAPDGRTAYVSDSIPHRRLILAYDYDPDDGAWTNRRPFFDTSQVAGRPDGACIDDAGCYWMAGVGGGHVLRITPAGRVDMDLPFPVPRPTRPAFGGPGMSTLHVTSIGGDGPGSGGVFACEVPGVRGLPMPLAT
jgi:sugar lactone lactonase YvrE